MFAKRLRHYANGYDFAHSLEDVWALIADPIQRRGYEKDPCYRIEYSDGPLDRVGATWTEIHTGEDCAGDVVDWIVTISDAPYVLQTTGVQVGIRLMVSHSLTPTTTGCRLTEDIVMSPAWTGRLGPSILPWILLGTGLLAKFANDPEENEARFKNLDAALDDAASRVAE